jgi:preprotein translocase subunit SecA
MNLQREIVYTHRNEILATDDTRRMVLDVIRDAVPTMAARFLEEREDHGMAIAALLRHLRSLLPIHAGETEIANLGERDLLPFLVSRTCEAYEKLAASLPAEIV